MYNNYAKYFDMIFPANKTTVDFLDTHLRGNKVLDIGCGSGEYAIALHNRKYDITGIDLDAEMIKYAKLKNEHINFKVENMLEMDNMKYDSLYCIGNTLVHLPTRENIQTFLNSCYSKLENGNLILQIINYERVLDQNIPSLPTIENQGITFERNYSIGKEKVTFSTILTAPEETYSDSVELLPIKKEELEMMLKTAGFTSIQSYAGFSDKPYHKDSYALVIVATK